MRKILGILFSWHAVVGLATIALVGSEILKYDYETNKTAIETVKAFNEKYEADKMTGACFWFLRTTPDMKNHMLDLLRFKTFTVQQASRESRKLFDLCVAGARNGKPPETAGDVEFARIDVSMEELFEMRVPFVKMLNAADLALGLYKTGAVNQAVVCENMIGNFWRAGKGGTREKTKMFEALELYKNEQLLAETLPNLVHFMDQINTGRCPRPRYLLTRFGEKIASATLNFFDQIWRRVAAQDLG